MIPRRFLLAFLAAAAAFAVPPVRAEDEMGLSEEKKALPDEDSPKPAPPAKKKPAKKKGYDYNKSKYKAHEPSQTSAYKFNERGEPIVGDKKKAPKKKKRSEPPEIGSGSLDCGAEESCSEKKTEADAL